MSHLKYKILRGLKHLKKMQAQSKLKKKIELWKEIEVYKEKTISTGCSYPDLLTLYETVRKRKPKEILECGPGLSTLIMSYALKENSEEGYSGKITAMEELEMYLEPSMKLLPDYLHPFVDFKLSPRVEDFFYLFRGVRYRDIPDKEYDFVFIDGPHHHAPSDDAFVFDFDFIHVLKNAKRPVYGIVDYRLTTCFVLQNILGKNKVKFNPISDLGYIGPCTKDDLLELNLTNLDKTLLKEASIIGDTQIKLC